MIDVTKILGGIYQPDSGTLIVGGTERHFQSAASSIAAGIAIIHQELHYVPNLTIAENLLLGHLPNHYGLFRRRDAIRIADGHLRRMGVALNPRAKLQNLVDRRTANGRDLQSAVARRADYRAWMNLPAAFRIMRPRSSFV